MEKTITILVGLVIIGCLWYFVRTLAKALVGISKIEQNHKELLQVLEGLKTEIKTLKQSHITANKSDLQ